MERSWFIQKKDVEATEKDRIDSKNRYDKSCDTQKEYE